MSASALPAEMSSASLFELFICRQLANRSWEEQDIVATKWVSFEALHAITSDVSWSMSNRSNVDFLNAAHEVFVPVGLDVKMQGYIEL